jgi:hypothetical protein
MSRRLPLSFAALAALILAAGCGGGSGGGGSSDEGQIKAVYQQAVDGLHAGDAGRFCDALGAKARKSLSGQALGLDCKKAMTLALAEDGDDLKKQDGGTLSDIEVDGDTATAQSSNGGQVQFARENGAWKFDADFNHGNDGSDDASADSGDDTPAPAELGQSITLAGQTDGAKIEVTADKLLDPLKAGQYDSPSEKGDRYVGITVELKNVGTDRYEDTPQNGAVLVYGDDAQADSAFVTGGPCARSDFSDVKIAPGDRRTGCLIFEVPEHEALKKLELTLASGFADQTGTWTLAGAASSSGASSSKSATASEQAQDSSAYAGPDHHACDQNITAGPSTTCGFADAVFKAYAAIDQATGTPQHSVDVEAKSPTTGETYTMTCVWDGVNVQCTGGNDARVAFPEKAARVY